MNLIKVGKTWPKCVTRFLLPSQVTSRWPYSERFHNGCEIQLDFQVHLWA